MEVRSIAGRGDKAGADCVVAEALTRLPLAHIGGKDRIERGNDAFVIEILGKELGQTLAIEGGAEIKVVFARRFADETNLRQIRPGAAIRATGHPDDNLVMA